MNKNQYVEYYNDLGKFKELHVEGLFYKYESEGANGNLPFFVWRGRDVREKNQKNDVNYGQVSLNFYPNYRKSRRFYKESWQEMHKILKKELGTIINYSISK